MKINANTTTRPDEAVQALCWTLKSSDAWSVVTEVLQGQIDVRERSILGGKLTPDEYAARCGEVRGMKLALELPERLTVDNDPVADDDSA